MVDETTDKANKEQVVLVFRWVHDALVAHEEFIGLYLTHSIRSEALVTMIKDTLLRMNLKIKHYSGQCYDGASSRSDAMKGVTKMLCDEETRAIFAHCYGHALNLAASDCVKQCNLIKIAFETVAEVSKLIKKSLKRGAAFEKLKLTLILKHKGFMPCVQHDGLCELHLGKVSLTTMRLFSWCGKKHWMFH